MATNNLTKFQAELRSTHISDVKYSIKLKQKEVNLKS